MKKIVLSILFTYLTLFGLSELKATYIPGNSISLGNVQYNNPATGGGFISQQSKNQEFTAITEFKDGSGTIITCPGNTQDATSGLTAAATAGGTIYIPANLHCYIDNWTPPNNTHVVCLGNNSGLKHLPTGTTTSMIVMSFTTGVTIDACLLDGNSVASSQPLIGVSNSTNIVLSNNIFQNIGTSGTLTKAISVFKSSISIRHNFALTNVNGAWLTVDYGAVSTNRVEALYNQLSGMRDNAMLFENSGSSSNSQSINCLIQGNEIGNITDAQNGTGQFGNGILIYQAWRCDIADNHLHDIAWAGIRLGAGAAFNNAHHNDIWNTLDNGMYCSEESGFGNDCADNHLWNTGGLSSTNQSMRLLGLPDILNHNFIYGGFTYGIHAEGAIVTNNYVFNTPIGFQLGAGSTTGGNKVSNNHCIISQLTGSGSIPVSGLNLGQPMAVCMLFDPGTNASLIEDLSNNDLGSGWQIPVGIVGANNSTTITGISQATQAVITLNGSNQYAVVGNQACIFWVQGMTQANGYCPVITAVSGSNITVNLNTTSFSAYATPTNGAYASVWILWNTTSGTPIQGFGNTYRIRNMDIPAIMVSGMKIGSHFWVTDGQCSGGLPSGSSIGVWVDKISASAFGCVLNSDGTISTSKQLVVNGSGTGTISLQDSTSGYSLFISPKTLTSNTTVTFP